MSYRLPLMMLLSACAYVASAAEPPKDPLTGATADPGLLPLFVNDAEGQVWLDVSESTEPLLLVSTIVHALGSNDVGLDRAQNGEPRLVEFRTVGKRVLLVQRNTRYVAHSADADEALAAREAFAESVLWSSEWQSSPSRPKSKLVDLGSLAKLDLHGVADRLKQTQQGAHTLDEGRSVVLAAQSASFPDNIEVSALLTFSGSGEGPFVQQVAADQKSLTLTQQLSFVRLPGPGFEARAYHPASGGFSIGRLDFAQAIDAPLEQRIQPRFRLEKPIRLPPEAQCENQSCFTSIAAHRSPFAAPCWKARTGGARLSMRQDSSTHSVPRSRPPTST
ncbi:MAG: DUF5117 domain-containing protein [Ahniella sp.]|nr:DUF5117 domain-containing protein [Ahniella sp.]